MTFLIPLVSIRHSRSFGLASSTRQRTSSILNLSRFEFPYSPGIQGGGGKKRKVGLRHGLLCLQLHYIALRVSNESSVSHSDLLFFSMHKHAHSFHYPQPQQASFVSLTKIPSSRHHSVFTHSLISKF